MSTNKKKYFCYEIYKNLAVWSHNGKLGYNPCSFYKGYIKTSTEFDLDGIWNSDEHVNLKKCVENNIPIPGCETCYAAEEAGLESRRLSSKKLYEEYHQDTAIDIDGPQGLDYSVGNLCNLKCTICGPDNSSQWLLDYQKLNPAKSIEIFQYKKHDQIEVNNTLLFSNIKNIHFHGGGEPLLSNNHIRLLEQVQEVKGLGDVRVFYNTNGTQRVNDKILKLWEKCKLIEIYFSIDDVEERFEYQRTNAHWNSVQQNLNWYFDNMPHNHMFKVNCTWSYLNLYYLPELYNWWREKFSANRYGDPVNLIFQKAQGALSIDHVSKSTHGHLMTRFAQYPEIQNLLLMLKVNNDSHMQFWNYIKKLDNIRKTDFNSTFSEWSKLL